MRFIVIILVIILTVLGIKEMINTYTNQKQNIESLIEADTLADKIKIPTGLKKEYNLILSGKSPFSNNYSINKNQDSQSELLVSIDKAASPITSLPVYAAEAASPITSLPSFIKKQHSNIKSKIKKYNIRNDSLIVDLLLYNNTDLDFFGKINIKCSFYDSNNKESDIFYWNTKASIKSKKTILLKDIDFGYVILNNNKNIWCYVEKVI